MDQYGLTDFKAILPIHPYPADTVSEEAIGHLVLRPGRKKKKVQDSSESKQNYHENTLGHNCEKGFHLSWLSGTLCLFASVSFLQSFP